MKSFLRKSVPKKVFHYYHLSLAHLAAFIYRYPSKKLVVIGVTGTKGKTSTANFLWSALEGAGIKTGIVSTANIRIGLKDQVNDFHMTMPGRFRIQKFLRQMVDAKCECAIVEVTSQGLIQNRHKGIDFDIAVFTNLSPEHIESHGSFDNYKKAKGILFDSISKSKQKFFRGNKVPKTIIVNTDDEHADFFRSFKADKVISFGIEKDADFRADQAFERNSGVDFNVRGVAARISLPGIFNVWNALPAFAVGEALGMSEEKIAAGVRNLSLVPGRMERIENNRGIELFVDYAHEKQSMSWAVKTAKELAKETNGKTIILLGAEGGGRDKVKRKDMGEIVGEQADLVIASNVDPYEDDPFPIADDIAKAAESKGKKRNENLFVILDRREGIRKALSLAKEGDVIMITGKGAEQSMVIGGKSIPWDDRRVVREELAKLS